MDNLQKLIVTFFIVTVLLSVSSLLMFFIEVPYKSTMECTKNITLQDADTLTGTHLTQNGDMETCVWTTPQEPSVFFNALINANIVCGVIFIGLSAYAFYRRSKSKQDVNTP